MVLFCYCLCLSLCLLTPRSTLFHPSHSPAPFSLFPSSPWSTVISTSTILSPFTEASLSLFSRSQSYDFSSCEVWIWELDHKESWVLKNWCFWTVVLEKTLESPLDCKEIQPVHPKGNQSWILIGRTYLKLKLQYLATSYEELTHWKRPCCWERLKAGGEGDDRG